MLHTCQNLTLLSKNRRPSQNPETGGFRELLLPKNDFKTCSAVNFPKKHADFGGLGTKQRHEIGT